MKIKEKKKKKRSKSKRRKTEENEKEYFEIIPCRPMQEVLPVYSVYEPCQD